MKFEEVVFDKQKHNVYRKMYDVYSDDSFKGTIHIPNDDAVIFMADWTDVEFSIDEMKEITAQMEELERDRQTHTIPELLLDQNPVLEYELHSVDKNNIQNPETELE